jgi:hypothetical protein
MRIILAVLSCLCAVSAAGSLPFARSGIIDAPMASVLRHTEIEVGGSFTAYGYQRPDSSSQSDFAIAGHIEVGLFERVQIGVTYLGAGGLSGQVRVLALRESISRPGIAIGVENITGEKNYEFFEGDSGLYAYPRSQNFSAYLVFTKNFDFLTGAPIFLNLGWGMGRFMQADNMTSDGFSNPVPGLFAAFEYHPNPLISIMIEWDGRDANIGGSYRLGTVARVSAAIAEIEQFIRGSSRNEQDVMQSTKFTLGVQFFFGPFLNRTTLEPTERLRRERDEEAMQQLEESRRHALEEIEALLRSMQP